MNLENENLEKFQSKIKTEALFTKYFECIFSVNNKFFIYI